MRNEDVKIMLVPLEPGDREQFIIDNQRAFKYGAQEEFFAELNIVLAVNTHTILFNHCFDCQHVTLHFSGKQ